MSEKKPDRKSSSEAAAGCVFAGFVALPRDAQSELLARLELHHRRLGDDPRTELYPLASKRDPIVAALKALTERLGHPPNTAEYRREYQSQKQAGVSQMPSVSAVLRHFGSWRSALANSGCLKGVPPSGTHGRRNVGGKIVNRYSHDRLLACLRACAADLGAVPRIRDYAVWREDKLPTLARRRGIPIDIPHYTTFRNRFGSWDAALRAAELEGDLKGRIEPRTYSGISSDVPHLGNGTGKQKHEQQSGRRIDPMFARDPSKRTKGPT